jgi:hypothetical protein
MSVRRQVLPLVALFTLVTAASASAQPRGVMADLVKDVTDVEGKIVGLANAIPESAWAWRPAPGVRTVA